MNRFTDWKLAHEFAQQRANSTGLNVAIRAAREFGKNGFNVSFASSSDSDYSLAEIVRPDVRPANSAG